MTATSHRVERPAADGAPRTTCRRRNHLLAVAVVAQPLLIGVNGTFHPDVDMEAVALLTGATGGPTSWYAVHLIAAIGALLGAPSALGLRSLLREHSRVGDLAVVSAAVAAIVLPLAFMAEASVLRLAVTADMDDTAALALTAEYLRAPEFYAVGVGVLAAGLAAVLFSAALLLERRVPRWIPTAIVVGTILATASPPGSAPAPVAFGIVAVAGIALARRVAAASR